MNGASAASSFRVCSFQQELSASMSFKHEQVMAMLVGNNEAYSLPAQASDEAQLGKQRQILQ